MGLDQYAYSAARAGQQDEYYDSWDGNTGNESLKPNEIAYWRKHPNLQGWMQRLWESKGRPGLEENHDQVDVMFNGIELELTWDDLEQLEKDINEGLLPSTTGFFFGSDADEYYKPQDLEFVKKAKAEIFYGFKMFYNSSW